MKKKGNKGEEIFVRTINSGAFNRDGDATSNNYAIEIKTTEKKGFRITEELLQKIWEQAFDKNKFPLFGIVIERPTERWILKIDICKERK